jgi:hypothetical protein
LDRMLYQLSAFRIIQDGFNGGGADVQTKQKTHNQTSQLFSSKNYKVEQWVVP